MRTIFKITSNSKTYERNDIKSSKSNSRNKLYHHHRKNIPIFKLASKIPQMLVSSKTISSHKNTNTINPIVEYIYDFVLISPSSCLLEYWTPSLSIYVFNAQFQIVTVEFQSSLAPTQWEFASLEILLHTHITQS